MRESSKDPLIQHIHRVALAPGDEVPDGQLLERFLQKGDENAFALLVKRHGPMVMGVCQRILRHSQDAEDACQATFLVLVRKAGSINPRDKVGHWLYGTACRTALEAKSLRAKYRAKLSALPARNVADSQEQPDDLACELDKEIYGLPEIYRSPVVLCDLQGKTRKEAARVLGCSEGTLSGRLFRARKILAGRLTRKGIGISAILMPAFLSEKASSASVPGGFAVSTAHAASAMLAKPTSVATVVTSTVLQLTEGVLRKMWMKQMKTVLIAGLIIGISALGLAALSWQVLAAKSGRPVLARKDRNAAQDKPVAGPPRGKAPGKPIARQKKPLNRIFFWRKGRMASVNLQGKDFRWHSEPEKKLAMQDPAWSPDGTKVVYGLIKVMPPPPLGEAPKNVPFDIYLKGADEKGRGQKLWPNYPYREHYWRWSRDGKYLLVSAWEHDTPINWLLNVQTKKKTRLSLPERHFATDISPDGQWLVTTWTPKEGDRKTPPAIYVVKKDGTKVRRLTPEQNTTKVAALLGLYSPDGQKVLYCCRIMKENSPTLLYVIATNGGKPRQVSQELNSDTMGYDWSPDGKQITSMWRQTHLKPNRQQPTESFLMIVNADGSNARTLLSLESRYSSEIILSTPSWR